MIRWLMRAVAIIFAVMGVLALVNLVVFARWQFAVAALVMGVWALGLVQLAAHEPPVRRLGEDPAQQVDLSNWRFAQRLISRGVDARLVPQLWTMIWGGAMLVAFILGGLAMSTLG